MTKTATEKRRVKHAMFTYHDEIPNQANPDGESQLIERIAYHGQEVELMPHDVVRGEKHGAFFTDEEPQAGEGAQHPSQFSHDDLVQWLRDVQPNVQTVINLADEDPDPVQAAEKLMEAEREATGGDPRQTLISGLESLKQGAEAERQGESQGAGE